MWIENDWLNLLLGRGEKVTSFKLTKHDFTVAYLDTPVLSFLLTGMQTWVVVGKNGYIQWLPWELSVYLVGEKEYDFAAYEWPWTKSDIPFYTIHTVQLSQT